jgi:hypothetical protein
MHSPTKQWVPIKDILNICMMSQLFRIKQSQELALPSVPNINISVQFKIYLHKIHLSEKSSFTGGFPYDERPSASTDEVPGIHGHTQPV